MDTTGKTDRLITALEAADLLGMSRSGFYAAKRQIGFPEPIRFGSRCVRWRVSDVNAWVENLTTSEVPA